MAPVIISGVLKAFEILKRSTELRDKLEDDPVRPRHLLTETGIGYRLVADRGPVAGEFAPLRAQLAVLREGLQTKSVR